MICNDCKRYGIKLSEILSFEERVHLLTSVVSMLGFLIRNPNTPAKDREISSSVLTKILTSFPEEQREKLMQVYQHGTGIGISLKDCPHGISVVQ